MLPPSLDNAGDSIKEGGPDAFRDPSMGDEPRPHVAGRIARLTLKELRETLRDRRTLITLVLMPFLLYPLLSLILRKFMLTGMIAGVAPTYHYAFSTPEDATVIQTMIDLGAPAVARRHPGEPRPVIQYFTSDNVDQSLRDGSVDVVVRVSKYPPTQQLGVNDSWEMDCEMTVMESSATGELAARHMEECLRAAGSLIIAQRFQSIGIHQRPSPIRPTWKKIASETKATVVSLSSLIPFVLILMTITGAVYPAIDLTAGERERGTLELLVATPVPRLGLLFAKYIAVLTVSMLTGTVNLLAMTATVLFSGLGPLLWGDRGLSIGTVVAVFCLLFLLASFFAAVLLAITSFARSFKEAQAYLIPLMLCALGPGVISLMPGVQLNAWLVVTPLLNVALLSRDVLQGEASVLMGAVVVASTALYAFAALAIAAKLFATDVVLSEARIGWSELWRRAPSGQSAGVAVALLCLACMFPLSFAANGAIAVLTDFSMAGKLAATTIATGVIYGAIPLLFIYWRRVPWDTGLQWRWPSLLSWLGAIALGASLWPFAHELTLATQKIGLVSLDEEQFARAKTLLEQLRSVSPILVLMAIAIAPAVFEEFCFRGFVFSSLRSRLRPWPSIVASAVLFGVFHLVTTDALAVERLVPSTFLGVVLGWICYRSGSVLPGIVTHACHNGFLTLVMLYEPWLKARGWGVAEKSHLPWMWLVFAGILAVFGIVVIRFFGNRTSDPPGSR